MLKPGATDYQKGHIFISDIFIRIITTGEGTSTRNGQEKTVFTGYDRKDIAFAEKLYNENAALIPWLDIPRIVMDIK